MNATGLLTGILERLRTVWAELRLGGRWPLWNWTCRSRTTPTSTVTILAPPAPPVPVDIPAQIHAALEETRRTGVPETAVAVLMDLGRTGVDVRALLRDGTSDRSPTLICVEPARAWKVRP